MRIEAKPRPSRWRLRWPARLLPATVLALAALAVAAAIGAFADTIDPNDDNSQFAYGENVGWFNAEPGGDGGSGITLTGTGAFLGYMWGENVGWVNFSCVNNDTCDAVQYGVAADFAGNVTGYAWGENIGWISMSCENNDTCATVQYGVSINPETGVFSGNAWGENIGWITFSDDAPHAYQVQTDDDDGVGAEDNCFYAVNPGQENGDSGPAPPAGNNGEWGNGPDIPDLDDTIPSGDAIGDLCDPDRDNDSLLDLDDGTTLSNCGAFNGTPAGHPNPTLGDITNSDANGPSWDTDNDQVLDGVECQAGTNPRALSPTDDNACATFVGTAEADNDADGLLDVREVCKWGTDPGDTNTDDDALGDCREAFDLNGNNVITNADAVFVQRDAFNIGAGDWTFDINGNQIITNADAVFIQRGVFSVEPCL
jgi:hypothetical protein